jgi:NhaA family Na+:H+ antiporter
MSEQNQDKKRNEQGIIYAPWERSFNRILTPFEEFIHRQTTSGLLLMGTAIIALLRASWPTCARQRCPSSPPSAAW